MPVVLNRSSAERFSPLYNPNWLGFDTETTGIDFKHGTKPFIVTTCTQDLEQEYWLADVNPVTREPEWTSKEIGEMKEKILGHKGLIVGQNPNFDIRALETLDKEFATEWPFEQTYCTLIAGHLIKSDQMPKDLTSLCLMTLKIDIKHFEEAIREATISARRYVGTRYPNWRKAQKGHEDMPSAKDETWKMDMWLPRAVCLHEKRSPTDPWWNVATEYSNPDSSVLIKLIQRQLEILKKRGLLNIYFERLKMIKDRHIIEGGGITLNSNRLDALLTEYQEESKRLGKVCTNIARGYNFEISMPKSGISKSMREFAFDVLKLEPVEYGKTGPSLNAKCREHYEATLPHNSRELAWINAVGGKSKRDTACSFMESYKRYGIKTSFKDWIVIYSTLNGTGTGTLRWSSNNPNEQNISKKEGFNLRYMFGPLEGREWWSCDYQNIELRIPAYESEEKTMIDLFERPDDPPFFGSNHLVSASIVYPELFWPLADQKGAFKKKYGATYYQWIKNFNFAVQYGSILKSSGWGTADRAAHRKGAHAMVMKNLSKLGGLNEAQIAYAQDHGYVETIPDIEVNRLRGYPLYCTRNDQGGILETVPLNYHVQGTACWVMMRATSKINEYLATVGPEYKLIMQIHDEFVFDFPAKPNQGNLPIIRNIERIMRNMGNNISVPLTVGIELHTDNWSVGESVKSLAS